MKKHIITISVCFSLLLLGALFFFRNFNVRGLWPTLKPPPQDITKLLEEKELPAAKNNTEFPLKLPAGFEISIFAKNLPGARVMARDRFSNFWVSQTSKGIISLLEVENGKVARQRTMFKNLRKPHGLAFDPSDGVTLYFAEEHKVSRVTTNSDDAPQKLFDLPSGGGHFTRTLLFGSDGRLYTSVGSSCNICHERDWRRAKVLVADKNGENLRTFASGLRNAVFMATNPVDRKIWATEMGRDLLGDDIPPDEINVLEEGRDYGWPFCYGRRMIDESYRENARFAPPDSVCDYTKSSFIDIPAHSAPLGLAFIPNSSLWPEDYWYDLLVAYHGSWNRTTPTGYNVVRMRMDAKGNYLGTEDFISGWLTKDGALGRPVDILTAQEGVAYISDDKAGVIYRLSRLQEAR